MIRLKTALLGTACAATLAASGAIAAAPAGAASTTPVLSVQLDGTAVIPGLSSGLNASITVSDPAIRQVQGLRVSLDTRALPRGVTIDTPGGSDWTCAAVRHRITCVSSATRSVSWSVYRPTGYVGSLGLAVRARSSAALATGSLTAIATATGLGRATDRRPFSVAEGVQLVAGQSPPRVSVADGETYQERWTVTNGGTNTVHGVALWTESDPGFDPATRYRNCRYDSSINGTFCFFANDLLPGRTYTLATPMGFRIASDHRAPFNGLTEGGWRTPLDLRNAFRLSSMKAGHGPKLSLVAGSGGAPAPVLTRAGRPQINLSDQSSFDVPVSVTGRLTVDLAAVGATAVAPKAGDQVQLALGVRDLGPAAAVLTRSGDPLTDAVVTLPAGTTATSVPLGCAPVVSGQPDWDLLDLPGYQAYECLLYTNLAVGGTAPLPFTVAVTGSSVGAPGSITLTFGSDAPKDADPTDDTAPIVLTAG